MFPSKHFILSLPLLSLALYVIAVLLLALAGQVTWRNFMLCLLPLCGTALIALGWLAAKRKAVRYPMLYRLVTNLLILSLVMLIFSFVAILLPDDLLNVIDNFLAFFYYKMLPILCFVSLFFTFSIIILDSIREEDDIQTAVIWGTQFLWGVLGCFSFVLVVLGIGAPLW